MNRAIFFTILFLSFQVSSVASQVKVPSKYSVEETAKRYEDALNVAQVPLLSETSFKKELPGGFLRTGKELQFSNPFYGWSLGECHRGQRKDKPISTKIYKDTRGQVWLEYAQPDSQVNSFGVIECGNETDKVRRALGEFADSATD